MPGAAFLYTSSMSFGYSSPMTVTTTLKREPSESRSGSRCICIRHESFSLVFCTSRLKALAHIASTNRAHSTDCHELCARVLRHGVRTTTQMHRVSAMEVLLSTIVITTTRALHHKTTKLPVPRPSHLDIASFKSPAASLVRSVPPDTRSASATSARPKSLASDLHSALPFSTKVPSAISALNRQSSSAAGQDSNSSEPAETACAAHSPATVDVCTHVDMLRIAVASASLAGVLASADADAANPSCELNQERRLED